MDLDLEQLAGNALGVLQVGGVEHGNPVALLVLVERLDVSLCIDAQHTLQKEHFVGG